ncbi:Mitogen-activated protein kinase kinase kinase 17 [Forsythia ovata]|uniref:Mitogen-activated protein kinase kinase kinase 17 n=1 Tax=Forsythia ovata TaxID=205694 RepID=A0ABD1UXN5_9LAMI
MSTIKWKKHQILGSGSYGTVHVASPSEHDPNSTDVVAVKSASFPHAYLLKNESNVLYELRGCPEIVLCFGDDISVENNKEVYNVMLEFAPGGTLADLIENYPGKMSEKLVVFYTRMLLKGLSHIHESFVHCDIKPRNILVFPCRKDGLNHLKIADFGLAKEAGKEQDFLRRCLAKEKSKRWTADKLLYHSFIVDNLVKVPENCDKVISSINPFGSCSWISTHDLFSTHDVDITSCPSSFPRLSSLSMYLSP